MQFRDANICKLTGFSLAFIFISSSYLRVTHKSIDKLINKPIAKLHNDIPINNITQDLFSLYNGIYMYVKHAGLETPDKITTFTMVTLGLKSN